MEYVHNLSLTPFLNCKSECKLNFQIAGVVMFNHASVDFEVKAGDRIAQLVCERIAYPEIQVKFTL